jgi:hypothetical protein
MSKKLLLIACIFATIQFSYSQSIYYDVVKLQTLIDNTTGKFKTDTVSLKEAGSVLYNYLISPAQPPELLDYSSIKLMLSTQSNRNFNPFLVNFLSTPGSGQSPALSSVSSAMKSIGGLNVTDFADGLAKFLVERSKEELNVAFFRKFQEFLTSYPEMKIIFPTTYDFLKEIYFYQYTAMLPALKAAFQKDLNAFSTNLLNLREISNYDGYFTNEKIRKRADEIIDLLKTPEGRSAIGAVIVTNGIVKGNNAADIINNLANDYVCKEFPDDNFSNTIRFVDLVSQSLRSNEEGRVWITMQQAGDLVKDDIALKIYLGLIYANDQQNSHPIKFTLDSSSITLKAFLTELSSKWPSAEALKFKESFAAMADAMSEISDNAKNVIDARQNGDQASILVYADYASSISRFLKLSVNFLSDNAGIDQSLSQLGLDLQKFSMVIDAATNACYDLKSQNYGALVLHTSAVLMELLGPGYTFKDEFIKYGIFMANVVEANNSDEVNAAIEAAVLPIGSSSIKRETDFNISLNAFIGPFGGAEYLPKLKIDQWAFATGITAPIGVALSWGNIGKGKTRSNGKVSGGKSMTLFIPVIDIGSMASFRMGNDSSAVASEVKLANIISPGLYFYYGFGKCPISIGLGGQLGPQLREVTATDVNIDKNFYFRFGINIVVDIPFFNLYTKN